MENDKIQTEFPLVIVAGKIVKGRDHIILRSNQKYPYTLVELIHMDIYVVKNKVLKYLYIV